MRNIMVLLYHNIMGGFIIRIGLGLDLLLGRDLKGTVGSLNLMVKKVQE